MNFIKKYENNIFRFDTIFIEEKMKQNTNFLNWLKNIEIEKLNEEYQEKINNFNFTKNLYLDENYEIQKDKIINFLTNPEEEIKKINDLIEKEEIKINIDQEKILNLGDWLIDLYKIHNLFSPENLLTNKMWKYKILYFIYGGFIYINQKLKESFYSKIKDITEKEIKEKIDNNFFIGEENVKWYAFKNGPITNHYNYLSEDDEININFKNMSEDMKEILKKFYLKLREFSLEKLIFESHQTPPWQESWNSSLNSKKWILIDKEKIINHFQKKSPFYLEALDE